MSSSSTRRISTRSSSANRSATEHRSASRAEGRTSRKRTAVNDTNQPRDTGVLESIVVANINDAIEKPNKKSKISNDIQQLDSTVSNKGNSNITPNNQPITITVNDTNSSSNDLIVNALLNKLTSTPLQSSNNSNDRRITIRLSDITKYKGDAGETFDNWSIQMAMRHRNYVHAQGAGEIQFVAAAAETLDAAAATWWLSVEVNNLPKTWKDMEDALRKQFQPVTSDVRAREELLDLKQLPKQSVPEYANAFRRLLNRAGSDFAVPNMQQLLTERFISGLRSQDIRRDLKKDAVKQLDRAIEIATRLDGCDSSSSSSNQVATASLVDNAVLTQLAAITARLDSMEKGKRGSSNQGQYESRRDRGVNKSNFGSLQRSVPGLTDAMAHARRENGQCMWCGSKEHIKRDCPDRVNKKSPTLN